MVLLLVSFPKDLVLLELDISFISLLHTPPNLNSMGFVPTPRVFWSSCRFLVNRSDTNCWNCESPTVQLYIIRLV